MTWPGVLQEELRRDREQNPPPPQLRDDWHGHHQPYLPIEATKRLIAALDHPTQPSGFDLLSAPIVGSASEPVAIEVTGDSGMPGEPGILVGTLEGSINVAAQQALTIGDGATIDGNITIGVGALLSFTGYNYYFYDDPTVTLNGLVALEGGTLAVQSNALTGNGAIEIGQGGALVITNGATFAPSISLDITFDPSGGTFSNIMYGASYTGTIHGFGAGDSIFISDEFSRFYSFSTSYADGVLTITPFEQSSEQIHFTGSYTIGNFDVQLAAGSSIEITYAPCFATGTLITTPTGHRRVETLAAGDTVSLASGTTARVIWLGHRRQIDGDVIRIRQHALGHHTPNRDLVVSADHGMFLDGVLVQAGLLVNGETILREHRDEVVFWHVEVERHGILLAEGAAAESYLDTGNRRQFGNCPLAYDPTHDMQELCVEMVLAGENPAPPRWPPPTPPSGTRPSRRLRSATRAGGASPAGEANAARRLASDVRPRQVAA